METAGSELRARITAAAVRCFRTKGYDEVSVNDICREADIARSTFYRVFSNKKNVIRCLFEHTDANSIVSIEELLSAQNDFDRMWIIGDRYISLCKELGKKGNTDYEKGIDSGFGSFSCDDIYLHGNGPGCFAGSRADTDGAGCV